jgi:hypothetical protein
LNNTSLDFIVDISKLGIEKMSEKSSNLNKLKQTDQCLIALLSDRLSILAASELPSLEERKDSGLGSIDKCDMRERV